MTRKNQSQQTETVYLTVPSHPRYLYVIRSALFPIVMNAAFSKKETRKVILALDEACSNIIKHAYEGDPSKQIMLTVSVESETLRIEVKDSGKRVDASMIAPRDLADIRPGGLGTHFIKSIFDTVQYDTSGPEGTVLRLVKKRPTVQQGTSGADNIG